MHYWTGRLLREQHVLMTEIVTFCTRKATSKHSTPSFRGNSYIVLPPPRIPIKEKRVGPSVSRTSPDTLSVSLNFSTIASNGLLFWSEPKSGRFLGLGIESGHIKLASHLLGTDSRTVDIPTAGFVADGAWHEVLLSVARRQIRLALDGRMIFEETQQVTLSDDRDATDRRTGYNELEHPIYIGKRLTFHILIFQ